MTVAEALGVVVPSLGDAICIASNGYLSRAVHHAGDRDANFYMIGSMGLASSIGLGVALAQPKRGVVVLDGDGNVLMNMGTLARIASAKPANLRHVCFDNGVHASTGAQATISDAVALDEVARAAGYAWVRRVDTQDALMAATTDLFASAGPGFLHVRVEPYTDGPPGVRVPHEPKAMTDRIRRAIGLEP